MSPSPSPPSPSRSSPSPPGPLSAGSGLRGPAVGSGGPLIVSTDPALREELARLAAAASVQPELAGGPGPALAAWPTAALVLVGVDQVAACAQAGMARRPGIVVVSAGPDEGELWQRAVQLGAEQVVFLPDGQGWLVSALADAVEGAGGGVVVGVVGGRGGAGATTLATALAVTAARLGHRALLVDADPLGGGLDLALGGEGASGLRWPELAGTHGRVSQSALSEALPVFGDRLAAVSWDRGDVLSIPAAAMSSILDAAVRGSDLVVVDLPRQPDPAAQEALRRTELTLLVVPAEVRACGAAGRVAAAVGPHCADLQVVVRGPAPSGLHADLVADALGLSLAGSLRAEPGLAAAYERGEPPARRGRGPLAGLCARLVGQLLSARVGVAA